MPRYADVALPVGVEREFTYSIPAELEDSAAIGVRVVVPFGRKLATGLIVGLAGTTSVQGIKPLRDILDGAPLVAPPLMHLCRWIADYYFSPLGEVLKAANPGAFLRASRRKATLATSLSPETLEELRRHFPKRSLIVTHLQERGPLTSAELQRLTGIAAINPALNELERAGILTTEEFLPLPPSATRMREYVLHASVNRERIAELITATPARNVRRRELLAAILCMHEQSPGDFPAADVLKRSGATTRTLQTVAAAGIIATVRREVKPDQEYGVDDQTLRITLNSDQRAARDAITATMRQRVWKTYLLHGVTGSGKTQVYIECIKEAQAAGRSAIVLVPEISLTPQIVRRFKSHFGDRVAVVHSRMSASERREIWRLTQRGDCQIVIGPRSAIFAPVRNPGLIVVDEEQEASYKQFDASPRYHARDVAVMRGSLESAVVLLGSATPSVESYQNTRTGKYTLLELPNRIDKVPMPAITIVDMTAERKRIYAALKESLPLEARGKLKTFQQPGISPLLEEKIRDRLERKEGIILLQNRRGYAPFVECPDCGYTESCENCNVTLTYHITRKHLRCHYCGLVRKPYLLCPQCGSAASTLRGIGTQRVEEDLATLFPAARVLRMDLDTTTRKGSHDKILRKFGSREADILLGTQMVAKGLDFPHVTLVGVISADTQMLLPDFRSAERTFQLLTQVAGRAGRSDLKGEVIIQTHQPAHYALAHVLDHNFRTFFEEEVQQRRLLSYPPFSRLILVETKGANEEKVRKGAEAFASLLRHMGSAPVILGPAPAVLTRIKNQFRWHTIVKSDKEQDPSGQVAHRILQRARQEYERKARGEVRLLIDVDPGGLM
jgi:primosomal protein N' (replication factor Y) (superfamily II helicase)